MSNKADLYNEITSATYMILKAEGLPDVGIIIKHGVSATYFKTIEKRQYIQYGTENIENKLNLSRSGVRYNYLISESGRFRNYTARYNSWLSPKERIACVVMEETAHAVALKRGYHGLHGAYFKAIYLELYKKYFVLVLEYLKSVEKYEVISINEFLAHSKREEMLLSDLNKFVGAFR